MRRAVWRWRSSMQLRVVTSTLVVGIVALAALGAYLSDSVRDGLFERRVAEIDLESAQSTERARQTLDASPATTVSEIQSLLYDLHGMLLSSGSASRDVFLWRPEDQPFIGLLDVSSNNQLEQLVSPELREATVEAEGKQVLQPVAVPTAPSDPDSPVVPGVVVGTTVEVPVAGTYELYYLYDLESDQETLTFLQSVLLVGAVVLLALLAAITTLVTRQAVLPVRQAASVAERLADGRLDERLPVKGHDEMASLARTLNEMAQSLQEQIGRMEELSMLQRRFVSDVSHELRTPLTTIRMRPRCCTPRARTSTPCRDAPPSCSRPSSTGSRTCSPTCWRSAASTPARRCSTRSAATCATSSWRPSSTPRPSPSARACGCPCTSGTSR
ncbi:HAMP domain-containing protein [Cellulosimicrobium sp. CUA-896]|uniref:HAMP domain-containing protein n=1 Tax=Cellulosimicrobium sp. CUA-896 TaxID=1517881 RepID=UPI00351570D8